MYFDDIPTGPSPHRTQTRLGDTAWEALKERYLAGDSANALAHRYGVALSTIRTRARDEGWRRSDAADPEITAPPTAAEMARDGRPNLGVMADTAMRRAARAVAEGHLLEAQGWVRVGRSLAAAARKERVNSSA